MMSLHLDRAQYKPEITVTQIRFQEEQATPFQTSLGSRS